MQAVVDVKPDQKEWAEFWKQIYMCGSFISLGQVSELTDG